MQILDLYVGCPESKFPYSVKNQKNTLKILKKFYFIPFEYIIFPHSYQKDSSIYHILRLIFVCTIGRTACPNLGNNFAQKFWLHHYRCSLSFPVLVILNDDLRWVAYESNRVNGFVRCHFWTTCARLVVHFVSPIAELSAPLYHHPYIHDINTVYLSLLSVNFNSTRIFCH